MTVRINRFGDISMTGLVRTNQRQDGPGRRGFRRKLDQPANAGAPAHDLAIAIFSLRRAKAPRVWSFRSAGPPGRPA